jgi:hypothetical protein
MTRSIKSLSNQQLNSHLWKKGCPNIDPRRWCHPQSTFDRAIISRWHVEGRVNQENRLLVEEALLRLDQPGYRPLRAANRVDVVPLDTDDDVYQAVAKMTTILQSLPIQYSLTNGNVEIFLKNFFGIAWVSLDPQSNGYVMDKQFGPRGEVAGSKPAIDLVAYRDRNARFWMEAKCTFAQCGLAAKQCASVALMQAFEYRANIGPSLENLQSYIVHFLSTIPSASDFQLPGELVEAKYDKLGKSCISPTELIDHYKEHANGQYHSSVHVQINVKPTVYAIVIKLKPLRTPLPEAEG